VRYESGGRHPIAVFSGPTGEHLVPLVNAHGKTVPIGTANAILENIASLGMTGLG
jgi:hypothetical protein